MLGVELYEVAVPFIAFAKVRHLVLLKMENLYWVTNFFLRDPD
jgi:hypothetical protein